MKLVRTIGALALAATIAPSLAWADDPNDPVLSRSAAARARDRAIIRELNRQELARVRERDARYAEGWQAYREQGGREAGYARQRADYDRAMDDYARQREAYARKHAEWRRAVAMCEAGRTEYCDR